MKIYLIESMKGNIQIATKLYLHDGYHRDTFEINIEKYNEIKLKLDNHDAFTDSRQNKWYFRNNGINGEVYYTNGIRNISEFNIDTFEDLYEACRHTKICVMDKVRLMEKININKLD